MSPVNGLQPPSEPGVSDSASTAWAAFTVAPFAYTAAGFLFFLISGSVPIVGSLLSGPMWVGLCNMGCISLRGETPDLSHFFAPFGDKRLQPSLLLGGVITVISFITSLVGMAIMGAGMFGSILAAQRGQMMVTTGVGSMVVGLLVMLLPIVIMAYYLFPAGYYIAMGETDGMAAIRRSYHVVSQRRVFWAAFWGRMTLGHFLGLLCCCFGLCAALPWNAIAIVHATAQIDPSVELPDHI